MKLTKTFLFVLMLLAPMCGWAEEQGYAVFKDGMLTFKYGEKETGDYVYDTDNTGEYGANWLVNKLKTVVFDKSFAKARPKSTRFWFFEESELTDIRGLQYLNTDEVESMAMMFRGCSSLKSLDVSHFNTNKVTDMVYMFCDCSGLTNLNLSNFDTGNVDDMRWMFSGCSGLTKLDVSHFNTSKVIAMDEMFRDCSSLTSLDLSSFDTTHMGPASMLDMFTGCINLQTIYVSDSWVVENVNYPPNATVVKAGEDVNKEQGYAKYDPTYGTLTFEYGKKPSGGYVYDTDNTGEYGPRWIDFVEKLKTVEFKESYAKARPKSTRDWFIAASKLTDILGLKYLNTEEVVSMNSMFNGCSSLSSLDVSHFNTSKVTDMILMFCDCSGLKNFDVSQFDTRNVEDMSGMFQGCSGLTSLDLSNFNTSKVEMMIEMFRDCSSLTSLDLRSFNTTHIASNGRVDVFTGCNNLKTIYIGDNWGLEEANYPPNSELVIEKERGHAVYDPETGTLTFKYGNKLSGKKIYYTDYEFDDNHNWPSWAGRGGLDKVKKIVIEPSFAKSRPKTTRGWFCFSNDQEETDYITKIEGLEYLNTSEVTDMSDMFWGLRGLTSIDLSHFDTSNVLNMWGMFALCSGLTRIDLSRFDTSNVLNMMEMFQGCSSLTSLDLSHFDTSNVLRMDNMFKGCSGLTKLDLSHFNTSNVTNMSSMFEDCSSLTNLDLSDFNTSNVTNMIFMFADCSSLRTIYVSDKWSTTKVTENTGIFYNCTNILGGKGTTYDSDNIKYARVDGGLDKPGYLTLINDDGSYPPEPEPIMPDLCLYNVLTSNTVALVDGSKVQGDYVIPETVKINGVEYTVTSIEYAAFYGNTALTSITIPKSIENIGLQAFSGCTRLTSFISLIENPLFTPWSSFGEWDDHLERWIYTTPAILYIPKGTADKYDSWVNYFSGIVEGESTVRMFNENHIKYTVEADRSIAIAEVDGNYWTESLHIPKNVTFGGTTYIPTKIKRNAFSSCRDLLSLTIPASITSIEDYGIWFSYNNLTSIVVDKDNPVYDSRDSCNAVIETATNTLIAGCQETTIPSSVTAIGKSAFSWCDNLLTIKLPDNLVSIGEEAFWCSGLRYIVLPPGLTSIGSYAFCCDHLVAVSSHIKNYFRLEENAFCIYETEGSTYIPSKATLYVPDGTFVEYLNRGWKEQFAGIEYGEPELFNKSGATYLAQSENTVAIMSSGVVEAEYVIPETVTHDGVDYTVTAIENEAFKDNTALTAVTIPETVVTIGDGAFAGCTGLTAIYAYAAEPANLATATTRAEAASSVFEGVDKETCVLYVPKGCVEKYRAAEGWGEFTHIVEMEGTGISGLTTNDHKAFDVYDMSGRKVRTAATSLDGLPKGIYIANGKKVILTK